VERKPLRPHRLRGSPRRELRFKGKHVELTFRWVLARIQVADLKASATELQWIISGYSLAFAIGLITGARLGDRYGRKRLFVAGSVAFGAASPCLSM